MGKLAEEKMQDYWTLVQYAETEYLRDKDLMSSLIISQRFTKGVPKVCPGKSLRVGPEVNKALNRISHGANRREADFHSACETSLLHLQTRLA